MTSVLAERPAVLGVQRPRVCSVPPAVSSSGGEAVELAASAGLVLDPWQAFVLDSALGERPDGKWAAFEVGLVVARQNGKGSILEARELAGLFLLGERFIVHSAHQFDTSLEAFRRLLALIEDTPDLDREVKRVSRSHGEEGIELVSGQRIRFRTRTKGGGRGFTGDCLILDEAMDLPLSAHGALLPTLSARPNPQVWYTGSAVDQLVHEHGVVLARVRERGIRGDDRLAYFEWSGEDPAEANPGLGIRISHEHVELERLSMEPRTFRVERLSLGDWPATTDEQDRVIGRADWDARAAVPAELTGLRFAVDVALDRSRTSIGVAGMRSDVRVQVEVVEDRPGTSWVVERLKELTSSWSASVALDAGGPAASLLPDLLAAGVPVEQFTRSEVVQACGAFLDAVNDGTLAHLNDPVLNEAVDSARLKPGESVVWTRKGAAQISPLYAVTLARWAAATGCFEAVPSIW